MNRSDRFAWVELTARWLPEIERIEQACFTAPWSRAGLESDLLSPTSHWYGAADRQTGRLAAFLGVHICLDEAEIVNVATHPDYRRLGLAEELLREFLRLHPALSQIFLEVRESNTAARTLYAKLGFSAYAVRRNYYEKPTEDAVLMRLQINRRELC
ncbi:MAG: ribosomal protein S18-alanine N-acetyltransferase [Clostridiaceae bacterium]|nr:ribosomal protein S18-alanine N-acetyltransferase [Clostridiaceae bacterium]